MSLATTTWTELDAGPPVVLALPLGSCEQHGPHLPLDTDSRVAEALAHRLAARVDGVLVAPPLTITASGEHAGFPGTLSIGTNALTTMLVEVGRSADWSAGLVLVNGHGGNRDAVDAAAAQLRAEGRRVLAWWPRVEGGDAHAGATETSIMLALAPDLVRPCGDVVGTTEPIAHLAGRLRRDGVRAVSATGVLGDASRADAATGAALLATLTDDLVQTVLTWREATP